MVEVKINYNDSWTSMPLSSLLIYYKKNSIKFRLLILNEPKLANCIFIEDNRQGKTILIDCNDSPKEILDVNVDKYFKRSFLNYFNYQNKIEPLGFTFPDYSQSLYLMMQLLKNSNYFNLIIKNKNVKIEAFRSIDICGLFTNMNAKYRNRLKWQSNEYPDNSKVLYKTRLWNPGNVIDPIKKEQREIMNQWRISMVDFLKRRFPDYSICGIQQDDYSKTTVNNELLLPLERMKMNLYLSELMSCGIGIADDGLEDTLGWKIGEFIYFGKPLVSTEIKVNLPGDFKENENYLSVSRRFDETIVGDRIEKLISNDELRRAMSRRNLEYAKNYLIDSKMAEHIYSVI